ncbi:cytosine deaminase [Bellilinea caldifistulae]|uniref:Cytosine deaminase n=1 Tax=Bellilinea caldifistulae TaxID=360411 RepID=A0A0N8GLW7_9CHLR|nr:amidohydrolase family protein [Bellilinea caldifistulae]KPL73650.1 cytosine deaminase [Bellilinea caldifistulae]GAP10288.1 cytosine deaminase [Bellilinea caldifistulae]
MTLDYLIKNAKTRFSGNELVQIGIKDGKIAAISPKIEGDAKRVVDADGHLVTESFVNGHLHLCKVYTLSMMDDEALGAYTGEAMGGAMTAIELAARVKEKYDESWIIENVRKAVKLAIRFGNTHIRAFADTDTKARLEGVKALIRAREEFKGKVDIQVVAFPQDGVVRDPGAEDYVEEALKLGADVVGGIPWIEYTDADAQEHIDRMFALAKKYNKPISMLIDDAGDPTLRTLEMLAVKTIKEGWEGRVTAQHARAMALYPEPYYRKIEYLLKRAQIGVVSDPQTGPLYARVKSLYKAGVRIALGQDDIADAYYPFGRNNMLEVAFLAAHLMWMTSREELEILYDLITTNAALALNIPNYGLKVGCNADLVILNANSVWEAIWNHEAPLHVFKDGVEITEK